MCTETGIKDVYRGVQGACPRRAVTHAGGTAERSERRAVGMGLKLVQHNRPTLSVANNCFSKGTWAVLPYFGLHLEFCRIL